MKRFVRLYMLGMILGIILFGLFAACGESTNSDETTQNTSDASVQAEEPGNQSIDNKSTIPQTTDTNVEQTSETNVDKDEKGYDQLIPYEQWKSENPEDPHGVEYIQNKITIRLLGKDVTVTVTQVDAETWPIVKLYVSLTDSDGRPLQLVNKKLLTVVENGFVIPKDDDVFQVESNLDAPITERIPINIALALDKSGSMAWGEQQRNVALPHQPITYAKQACVNFLERIGPLDRVSVFAFDHQIIELGENLGAVRGIQELAASGDTALYAVVFKSAFSLKDKEGAKAIIVMTDGRNDVERVKNEEVKIPLENALQMANDSSIPIFPIAFGSGADREVLQRMAEDTNGTYYETPEKEEIDLLYQNIQNIINNQYIITYHSRSRDAVLDFVIIQGNEESRGKMMQLPDDVKAQLKKLDDQKAELDEQAKELEIREEAVRTKEVEQEKKDQELTIREDAVKEKEAELQQLQQTLDDLDAQIEAARQKMEERKVKLNEDQENLAQQRRELDQRETQYKEELSQLERREQQLTQREQEARTKEQELNQLERQLNTRNTELDARQRELEQQNTELSNWENRLNTQEQNLEAMRTELDNRSTELERQKQELETLETQVAQRERENNATETRLNNKQRELDALQTELNQETQRLTQLENELTQKLENVKREQQLVDQAQNEIERQRNEIEDLRNQIRDREAKINQLQERLKRILTDLGIEIEDAQNELDD